eukprot:7145978-Alexandrium_andersonii.AAC.1
MSASLVGSEMCIRDSTCSSNFGTYTLVPGVRSLDCAGPGTAATSLPEAVSYTHLTLPTICSV